MCICDLSRVGDERCTAPQVTQWGEEGQTIGSLADQHDGVSFLMNTALRLQVCISHQENLLRLR